MMVGLSSGNRESLLCKRSHPEKTSAFAEYFQELSGASFVDSPRSTPRTDGLEPRPIARLVPEQPFPAYSYVPGHFPHPLSDPRGHSFGVQPERPASLDPEHWRLSRPYLYALDLFNYGYYWEAHEV